MKDDATQAEVCSSARRLGLEPGRAEATPPAAWDEWAMRRASQVYDSTVMQHIGNDSRCRAAIHVALVDAMRYATDATRSELALTQRAWRDDSNSKALEAAKLRRPELLMPLEQIAALWNSLPIDMEAEAIVSFVRGVERWHGLAPNV